MRLTRILFGACAALALLPATAIAQGAAPGDSYLGPILLNGGTLANPQPVPDGSVPGFQIDTTGFGVQPDLFNPPASGGPSEPTQCGQSGDTYGATAWAVFYAHRYGRIDVKAAGGYDQTLAVVPFKDPQQDPTPLISGGICVDNIRGINEDFGDNPPAVAPGWYAIQFGAVGGTGGVLQGTSEFLQPERLPGDAVLSWNGGGGGATVSVKATAPKGSTITFKCVNKSCGKLPKAQTIKKVSGNSLRRPIGDVTPRVAPGRELVEYKIDAPVHLARAYIKNKFMTNGVKFEVRITAPGFIGNYFSWNVGGGKVGTKTRRCINPGSSKPARRCHG